MLHPKREGSKKGHRPRPEPLRVTKSPGQTMSNMYRIASSSPHPRVMSSRVSVCPRVFHTRQPPAKVPGIQAPCPHAPESRRGRCPDDRPMSLRCHLRCATRSFGGTRTQTARLVKRLDIRSFWLFLTLLETIMVDKHILNTEYQRGPPFVRCCGLTFSFTYPKGNGREGFLTPASSSTHVSQNWV